MQVAAGVQDHRGDQAQALIDVPGSHAQPNTVIAHGLQVPVGKHLLDVLEQPQCLVTAQEGVSRQDDPAHHQAVEPRHQPVALALTLVVAQHGGEHEFIAAVSVGRPPAFLPSTAGVSGEPVQDLGRVQQPHVPPVPVRLGIAGWPGRTGGQQRENFGAGQVVVGPDSSLVGFQLVVDEQRPRRNRSGSRQSDGVGPPRSLPGHANSPPNSTSRSLAS